MNIFVGIVLIAIVGIAIWAMLFKKETPAHLIEEVAKEVEPAPVTVVEHKEKTEVKPKAPRKPRAPKKPVSATKATAPKKPKAPKKAK
jgi:outer membrane biosynthesis protein TonB